MGFRGVLPPRETGGARALPETGDAEEQLHPVPAEGVCWPIPRTLAATSPPQAEIPARVPSCVMNPLYVLFLLNLLVWLAFGG